MSATNTTTNYGLPIFIETDKPAWLVDFNGAMRTIDATLKTNADAIATKSPILTFNDTNEIDFTKTGDIVTAHLASGVSDKVGRALVTPISAPAAEQLVGIDTSGSQEAVTLGNGLTLYSGILSAIDLNLTDTGVSAVSIQTGEGTVNNSLSYAFNSDRSIGKIYGNINVINGRQGYDYIINTGITVKPTGAAYTIGNVGIGFQGLNAVKNILDPSLHVSATGEVTVRFTSRYVANDGYYLRLFPCIYFFTNFGDEPVTP